MRAVRLLLTSAGRRVELLQCFRAAASELGVDLRIFACDQAPDWSSACRSADLAFAVPPVTDADYVPTLFDICRRQEMTMLVPTIDPELAPLSEARALFRGIGVDAIVSSPAAIGIAGDKLATSELLLAHGIDSPRTATPDHVLDAPGEWTWPLLIKPRHGSSGRSVRTVANAAELRGVTMNEPFVAQELLRGDEYTVNIFVDREGALHCAVPHRRVQIRAGEVEKGVTCRLPVLTDMARKIAACLPGARGPLCFQAMVDKDGRCSAFEINGRFGGGYPLAHRAGAPFTRWLLEEAIGDQSSADDAWREGVIMLRYDAALFVEP
jgi:carbamoyl-phosphate synthase large subunit